MQKITVRLQFDGLDILENPTATGFMAGRERYFA